MFLLSIPKPTITRYNLQCQAHTGTDYRFGGGAMVEEVHYVINEDTLQSRRKGDDANEFL